MTATAEAPAQASTEVATYVATVMDEYRPRIVMEPAEAAALDEALRTNMKAVLRDGVDYGVIPGTGTKPTLLKPGAEKLLQWFGFGHATEVTETERDAEGNWAGVTYRCTVTKSMPDGRTVVVAMCEGYAGYDEDRFYLSAEAATAKEKANAEKYHRNPNPMKCLEYRAPRNSVVKMAQKRALVGAALQATSASTLFTQDVEDNAPIVPDAGPRVVDVAKSVIMALPQDVRTELDNWYRAERWPAPGNWDAEQWCSALVQAGRLWAAASSPTTAEVVPDLDPEDAWAFRVQEIANHADAEAVGSEVDNAVVTGGLSEDKAGAVRVAIRARQAELERQAAA